VSDRFTRDAAAGEVELPTSIHLIAGRRPLGRLANDIRMYTRVKYTYYKILQDMLLNTVCEVQLS
jgi:hypothetical protein